MLPALAALAGAAKPLLAKAGSGLLKNYLPQLGMQAGNRILFGQGGGGMNPQLLQQLLQQQQSQNNFQSVIGSPGE